VVAPTNFVLKLNPRPKKESAQEAGTAAIGTAKKLEDFHIRAPVAFYLM
jgi:hypothetical protein